MKTEPGPGKTCLKREHDNYRLPVYLSIPPSFIRHSWARDNKHGGNIPTTGMTDALKLRSCQLLKHYDGNPPRSVHSGLLGYVCVSGGGDFSVGIPSMFKWDGNVGAGMDAWHVGATGVITSLSTPRAEWEECNVK